MRQLDRIRYYDIARTPWVMPPDFSQYFDANWEGNALDVLNDDAIPHRYRLQVVLHQLFLPKGISRQFMLTLIGSVLPTNKLHDLTDCFDTIVQAGNNQPALDAVNKAVAVMRTDRGVMLTEYEEILFSLLSIASGHAGEFIAARQTVSLICNKLTDYKRDITREGVTKLLIDTITIWLIGDLDMLPSWVKPPRRNYDGITEPTAQEPSRDTVSSQLSD